MDIASLIEGRASSEIVSCTVDTRVSDAIALLSSRRIGALPIMDDGRVVGIFSERDVIYRLADQGESCLTSAVGEVMTSPAITVDRGTSILDALALITRRRIRHLPVVENGSMIGFISIGDLVKSRLEEVQHEAEAMREYIQTA